MPNFYLPFTGDVTQSINPWTWFIKSVGNQFGFININLGKSADPELEQQILDEVGTYGRQLGQMGDALNVLLNRLQPGSLDPDEQQAVDAFRLHLAQISQLKARRPRS